MRSPTLGLQLAYTTVCGCLPERPADLTERFPTDFDTAVGVFAFRRVAPMGVESRTYRDDGGNRQGAMGLANQPSVRVRTGIVGAYVGAGDAEFVRVVRRVAGRVTVSGKNGLRVVTALAKAGDLNGVDLDPAGYLVSRSDQMALFGEDWTGRQRDLGLRVVRSQGRYVARGDKEALRQAMTEAIAADVVRVVSLHETWLRGENLRLLTDAVRACDNALAFVFAGVMDPFAANGAVEGLQELNDAARADGRRVELLRTDLTGIAFAAQGGSLGAIGLSTSGRHHGLPMPLEQREEYLDRKRWPLVLVPSLAGWQRGNRLGALSEFAGGGITDCGCAPCDGRSLLRFDRGWPKQVPQEVRSDARAHDVAEWYRLAGRILTDPEPRRAWARACADALTTAATIAAEYKVAFELPRSLRVWAQSVD
jgi:hypothetical protein